MNPVILYRKVQSPTEDQVELDAIGKAGIPVVTNRTAIPSGSLVVGRYSVLPFYKELFDDLLIRDSRLVNVPWHHQTLADCRCWIRVIPDLTPGYVDNISTLPEKGPWVIKGITNSRKNQWNTHMFAETKADAIRIMMDLMSDSLIGTQDIIARPYVPLKKLGEGINGMPVANEYRFFVMNGEVLAGGFYWSSHIDGELPPVPLEAFQLAQTVASRIKLPFYAVDVAEKAAGGWIVIELNDGQMSGLSGVDANTLYTNMKRVLDGDKSTYLR